MRELASEQSLRARLTNSILRIFVAEEASRILGFASMKRIDTAAVELSGVVVLRGIARRGTGSQLFTIARKFAVAEGYSRVVVTTEAFNETAIAFYKKLGFVETTEMVEDVEGTEVRLKAMERSLP